MQPEIASIHERMAVGGDWHNWREEIAALHEKATTEQEYITLLRAHQILVEVGKHAFDADTYEKLLPIARAEYMWFLSREAKEGGELVNPMMLDRITAREVEAGRMEPHDDFREFAQASGEVMGDSADLNYHACRHGSWFFAGMSAASVATWLLSLSQIALSPLWLIGSGLIIGWFLNSREHVSIKRQVAENRAARQVYD